MVHVSWHPAESSTEDRMTQEKCLYQMMCEETPSGQILFRIYEYLQTPGSPLRMLGGAVVYARSHEGSPDRIRYRYRPHDRKGSYSLPAIRLCRDSMEEVCRKGLSFFLPFRYGLFVHHRISRPPEGGKRFFKPVRPGQDVIGVVG